jgi:hypothetical protein
MRSDIMLIVITLNVTMFIVVMFGVKADCYTEYHYAQNHYAG